MSVQKVPSPFTDNRNCTWETESSIACSQRKVVLIGGGMVGQAFIYSAMNQGVADMYGIIDVMGDVAYGNELDFEDAIPSLPHPCHVKAGGYEMLDGADVCVITAGRPQRPGETRLEMVQDNARIVRTIADNVKKNNFKGITIIVANPVDVMTMVYLQHTGFDPRRVISSGTSLDSARLQFELSTTLHCKASDVNCYVLGEHGDSSIATYKYGTVGGAPLKALLAECQDDGEATLDQRCVDAHTKVFKKAYEIINRKKFTNYGIGAAIARLTKNILTDARGVFPVGILLDGSYGESGSVCSVLTVLGKDGVNRVLEMPLGKHEQAAFVKSSQLMKETYLSTFADGKEVGVSLSSHAGWTKKL